MSFQNVVNQCGDYLGLQVHEMTVLIAAAGGMFQLAVLTHPPNKAGQRGVSLAMHATKKCKV